MIKKYYGYFVYNGEEYVILFRIKGSLQWDPKAGCFEDKDLYVRSADDMICYAALDRNRANVKAFSFGMLLSHERFKQERARGVKRWTPWVPIIKWD